MTHSLRIAFGAGFILSAVVTASCQGLRFSVTNAGRAATASTGSPRNSGPWGERLETLSGVPDALKAFERAIASEKSQPRDALARQRLIEDLQNCSTFVGGVTAQAYFKPYLNQPTATSVGPLTLPDMDKRCTEASRRLWATPVDGCGVRRVEIKSVHLGGGQWSRPELLPNLSYSPVACSDLPKPKPAPAELRELVQAVATGCRKNPNVRFVDDEWKVRPLVSGQVIRTLTALCLLKGTHADWGSTPD